jgi:iron complex transport system ATP-binding protein
MTEPGVQAPALEAPALEAQGLGFQVDGWTLVADVDLAVEHGELLAIVGPNGAGKSTLCALLAGDLTPTAGTVLVDGRPLAAYRPRELARRRAVLLQRHGLAFGFPVRDVVMMGRHPHLRRGHGPQLTDDALVDAALAATDVAHLARRSVTTLSGGEQTRVALARVYAQHARLLLLDEPTSALDLRHQHEVLALCRRLADEGAAVLAVLHDLSLAAAWADRVGAMRDGRLRAIGTPREVLTPEVVQDVFEHPVVVVDHPTEGWPVVLASAGTFGKHTDPAGTRERTAR